MTPSTRVSPASARRLAAAIAALTCLVTVAQGSAGSRPRYGGVLRLETAGVLRTLDPAATLSDVESAAAQDALLPLVFETLTRVDGGGLQPLLAQSWRSEAQDRRWRVQLRPGVRLHDGTLLTPAAVAQSLTAGSTGWTARPEGGDVVIEADRAMPDLPWELAELRRAIVVPGPSALPLGSGPFRLDRWQPGQRLVLAANDDYRDGRPFVDSVQVDMARPAREGVMDLEAGRADLVPLLPQAGRQVSERGLRVETSQTRELLALVFDTRRPAASQELLRAAVGRAIDRAAICTILLQRRAEIAHSLLPDWLGGYASIFASRYDPAGARAIVASLSPGRRTLSLDYPASDALAQAVADRIVVDLREAGLTIAMTAASRPAGAPPDGRLVRVLLAATTPDRALAALLVPLGLAAADAPAAGSSTESVATLEQALLERAAVVPIVHVPRIYAAGTRVQMWNAPLLTRSGRLDLANVWLREEKP